MVGTFIVPQGRASGYVFFGISCVLMGEGIGVISFAGQGGRII